MWLNRQYKSSALLQVLSNTNEGERQGPLFIEISSLAYCVQILCSYLVCFGAVEGKRREIANDWSPTALTLCVGKAGAIGQNTVGGFDTGCGQPFGRHWSPHLCQLLQLRDLIPDAVLQLLALVGRRLQEGVDESRRHAAVRSPTA